MKKFLRIIKIIFLLFVMFVSYAIYVVGIQTHNTKNKELKVKKGDLISNIYGNLNIKYGIIDRIFFKINKEYEIVKVGRYMFDRNLTKYELIKVLHMSKPNNISITIPEGFTSEQVLERIVSSGLATKKELLETLKNYNFYYKHNEVFEGYFFPDTYYFNEEDTPKEIFDKIFGHFLEKYPIRVYDKDKFYDTIILASIIEKEAGGSDDRTKISAVFHNRIKINMLLQSDATLKYGLKRNIYKSDLMSSNSKYNTYKHKGLTPTPISNPGEESIYAAMNPAKIESLYFFMHEGKTYYSKTHEEHLRKRKESGHIK
ncbi:endolytic transglycosylase MltG [Oceanivirga salmonicida]|uniref:endolytic transglycosylase MltG n=1 Tax=Oceanivirga salmonicida TaxID=1769291 RepID=UPI0018CC0F98|nr:endolytic transglycosylase MltG [Oceanivirga salmonicida]